MSRRAFVAGACAVGCLAVAGCAGGGEPESEQTGPVQIPVGDVPVGGGVILRPGRVVVTQPEPGVFQAFSAVCTHQSCLVSAVNQSRIVCRCHGSQFAIEDGAVLVGPAQEPLPSRTVAVSGDMLTIGT
ncbi:Rieske (2Fe-2S) protein [Rhodococcus gannanensis]|uniref:Cytochrome bc1 complex Rieske iron-sulfur subunit n=1 Tax=Rhodococcus gannanensis TaxID=1960308 RepID=A0ABW4P1V0_9NOCA